MSAEPLTSEKVIVGLPDTTAAAATQRLKVEANGEIWTVDVTKQKEAKTTTKNSESTDEEKKENNIENTVSAVYGKFVAIAEEIQKIVDEKIQKRNNTTTISDANKMVTEFKALHVRIDKMREVVASDSDSVAVEQIKSIRKKAFNNFNDFFFDQQYISFIEEQTEVIKNYNDWLTTAGEIKDDDDSDKAGVLIKKMVETYKEFSDSITKKLKDEKVLNDVFKYVSSSGGGAKHKKTKRRTKRKTKRMRKSMRKTKRRHKSKKRRKTKRRRRKR